VHEEDRGNVALLAKDLHVLPHWAGSRSPDADPALTGAVVGLTFDTSLDALARMYLAALQSLALGTKHIVDALEGGGHGPISHLFISGGLGVKNRLLLQAHADATGRALVLPGGGDEAVLLGAAVVAAVAAGAYRSVEAGMAGMTRAGVVVQPNGDPRVRALYGAKEAAYHELRELQLRTRRVMDGQG
jgi:ribulose kinase